MSDLHFYGIFQLADLNGSWENSEIMDFTINLGEELIATIKEDIDKMDPITTISDNEEFFKEVNKELAKKNKSYSQDIFIKRINDFISDFMTYSEDTVFKKVTFNLVEGEYDYHVIFNISVQDIVDCLGE